MDDLGRPWTGALPARRAISLAPNVTEIVCALGARGRLVGIDTYSHYPPEVKGIPQVGQFLAPSLERIVALRPDVVIVSSATITPPAARDFQARVGVPVFVLRGRRLGDVGHGIRVLARLLGCDSAGARLAGQLQGKLDGVARAVAGRPRPRVFFEVWHEPLQTAAQDTLIDDLVTLAGGKNVVAGQARDFPVFSLEMLLAADPDVYVVTTEHGRLAGTDPLSRPGYSALRAVRRGRVCRVPSDPVLQPIPRVAEGAEALARAIHPEAFP